MPCCPCPCPGRAGAGRSLPLVHGGGGSSSPFMGGGGGPLSLFVSPHCLSIVSIHRLVAMLLRATWHLGMHLDSKQWGGEVVVYSLGWLKTTRR